LWSILPDTIFINVKEIIEDGINLGGKFLGVTRVPSIKNLENLATSLSIAISLISKEASREVVMDGLVPLLSKHSKNISEIEQKLADVFSTSSPTPKLTDSATTISFRLQLGSDTKIINAILTAYKNYLKNTPIPKIGLYVDYDKGKISDVSGTLAEIIVLGGKVFFSKGITKSTKSTKNSGSANIKLESLSINLPRLALESNKDETYFRARLALLMKPALSSMALRMKEISDLTRRGLSPILATNTQFMQRSTVSLVVNLTGLHEAVFSILGYTNNKEGQGILHKVIETAVDVATKKGKEIGENITVSMTESEGATRFATLDGEKYGKNSILKSLEGDSYSEGITINASEMGELNPKSEQIVECNKLNKILNDGLSVTLKFNQEASVGDVKGAIEKISDLTTSFKPIKSVPICGNCGFKDGKLDEKCPSCKSPFIIS
jgi:ribonucleoside-triphosphate reductase